LRVIKKERRLLELASVPRIGVEALITDY
jgi:hypothetical protein